METTITDWITALCAVLSIIIACIALFVAFKQIKQVNLQLLNLNDSFRNSTLMTVLELENELIRRKVSWDYESFSLRQYGIDIANNQKEISKDYLELLIDKEKIAFENYLNSLDRFCYCIIHNYISDRDWRIEYRDIIFDIVDNRSDQFGVSSRFRNTIKLYKKWKNE